MRNTRKRKLFSSEPETLKRVCFKAEVSSFPLVPNLRHVTDLNITAYVNDQLFINCLSDSFARVTVRHSDRECGLGKIVCEGLQGCKLLIPRSRIGNL